MVAWLLISCRWRIMCFQSCTPPSHLLQLFYPLILLLSLGDRGDGESCYSRVLASSLLEGYVIPSPCSWYFMLFSGSSTGPSFTSTSDASLCSTGVLRSLDPSPEDPQQLLVPFTRSPLSCKSWCSHHSTTAYALAIACFAPKGQCKKGTG